MFLSHMEQRGAYSYDRPRWADNLPESDFGGIIAYEGKQKPACEKHTNKKCKPREKKEAKIMAKENALVVFKRKARSFLLSHTRCGRIDRLDHLTKSLVSNTELVKTKYAELAVVERDVASTLKKLQEMDFIEENKALGALNLLPEEERDKFKGALIKIKAKGLTDLNPISEMAQRIKAHMLITLNKANIQKAILIAKSKLAGNANLQLETLRELGKETSSINTELKDLLIELDVLNEGVINKFASFQRDAKELATDKEINIIDHIAEKLTIIENSGAAIEEESNK